MAEAAKQEQRLGARQVKPYKVQAADELKQKIEAARDVLFADYRGLTVEQITGLRASLREHECTFMVVKNNYARRAFQEMGVEAVLPAFVGPTAFAMTGRDAGPVAKVLFDFARSTTLEVKGGYVDGRAMDTAQVQTLSSLPGRDQLIAMLMSAAQAPVSNLVYVLNGVIQKLLRTLMAVGEAKEKGA